MKHRCEWGTSDDLYIEYHDKEWGIPVHDDQKLFEISGVTPSLYTLDIFN